MPNTNFQTIHQMGGAINSFVKQATGRDAVQNIDMEHITVAQNHYYEDVDISGRVVSFNADAAGIPLEKCLVQIEPVQEGTGDPSPDNVRPITGWTGAKVTRTGKNLLCKPFEHYSNVSTDLSNYFWIKAGIYTLSIDSSTSTVWRYIARLKDRNGNVLSDNAHNPSPNFTYRSALNGYTNGTNVSAKYIILNIVEDCYACFLFWNTDNGASDSFSGVQLELGSSVTEYTPYTGQTYDITFPSEAGTVYGGTLDVTTGVLTVDKAAPITYQLPPQEVRTILGMNNIWADTGDIEVKFKKIKEFF